MKTLDLDFKDNEQVLLHSPTLQQHARVICFYSDLLILDELVAKPRLKAYPFLVKPHRTY